MTAPDDLVQSYLAARTERDLAQARLDELGEMLMKQMEADQRKSYRWTDEDHQYSVSYSVAHTTVIDEKGLRRALTAKVFDKYTKKVLDRPAMERAMDDGTIEPSTVYRFVKQKPNKPHLTLKVKENDG